MGPTVDGVVAAAGRYGASPAIAGKLSDGLPGDGTERLRIVEFQRFLIALSVRPGSRLEISTQWLPSCSAHERQPSTPIRKQSLRAYLGVSLKKDTVFFVSPALLFDVRVKLVVPSLTALLSCTSWEIRRNQRPTLWTILSNKAHNNVVLVFPPRPFQCRGLASLRLLFRVKAA